MGALCWKILANASNLEEDSACGTDHAVTTCSPDRFKHIPQKKTCVQRKKWHGWQGTWGTGRPWLEQQLTHIHGFTMRDFARIFIVRNVSRTTSFLSHFSERNFMSIFLIYFAYLYTICTILLSWSSWMYIRLYGGSVHQWDKYSAPQTFLHKRNCIHPRGRNCSVPTGAPSRNK